MSAKFQRTFPVNPSGGCSLPTTGRPIPPRSMCTVFPEGKSAPIMYAEATSVAPSSTMNVMRRPIRPLPGITRSKTNRPSGPVVVRCCVKMCRHVRSVGVQPADVDLDRHVRGRRLADPEGPLHPGPRLQADDPGCPLGRRFDVREARGMRDHELKVLVLRREMEAAGIVGLRARAVCLAIADVAVLDVDLRPGDAQGDLGPRRGEVARRHDLGDDVLPPLQLEIDRDGPLVALDVARDRRLVSVGFDADQVRGIARGPADLVMAVGGDEAVVSCSRTSAPARTAPPGRPGTP